MATKTQAPAVTALHERFSLAAREDKAEVVERNEEVELIWQCFLARIHILLLGDPGIAKSMLARLLYRHFPAAKYFEQLTFKFTRDEQVLGPISMKGLENDEFKRVVTGKLPEANIAFWDEVFKASASLMNAGLKILNERKFENNGGEIDVPLWICLFASNELPGLDRDDLRAFRDRIAVTKIVRDVRADDSFKSIIRGQIARRRGISLANSLTEFTLDEVDQAHTEVDAIELPDNVLDEVARLRRMCDEEQLYVSPRRFGEGVKLMQARRYMMSGAGSECTTDDIKVFQHVLWRDPEDEDKAYRVCLDFASEFERAGARFQEEYDPLKAEFGELKTLGSIDPNDQVTLNKAIRVKRLLDMLVEKVDGKLEDAEKQSREAGTLDELANSIREDITWINREAFGLNT